MGTKPICGAKTRSGGVCQNAPMDNGSGRCRMHGGMSPRGPAHWKWSGGSERSHYLPTRLAKRFEAAMADTELLSTRADIALVEVRISELMERIDQRESGRAWEDLAEAYGALDDCLHSGDSAKLIETMKRMDGIIKAGQDDYHVWREIMDAMEQRRKLAESERKRLVDMQQYITTERVIVFVNKIVEIIAGAISDKRELSKILEGIAGLLRNGENRDVIDIDADS